MTEPELVPGPDGARRITARRVEPVRAFIEGLGEMETHVVLSDGEFKMMIPAEVYDGIDPQVLRAYFEDRREETARS